MTDFFGGHTGWLLGYVIGLVVVLVVVALVVPILLLAWRRCISSSLLSYPLCLGTVKKRPSAPGKVQKA